MVLDDNECTRGPAWSGTLLGFWSGLCVASGGTNGYSIFDRMQVLVQFVKEQV